MRLGDGSTVLIKLKWKGTIALKCKNGEQRVLEYVYYVLYSSDRKVYGTNSAIYR